jgi:hypothetical protein
MQVKQLCWEDVEENDAIEPVEFPLPVYRLIMFAGGMRDFNSLHHNPDVARQRGAPDMFVNNTALFVMWERAIRNYIGLAGTITNVRGFRMGTFNTVGETLKVSGHVTRKWQDAESPGKGSVELSVQTDSSKGVTVGPGTIVVTLPCRGAA